MIAATLAPTENQLQFDDNRLLPLLFGACNENLTRIEQKLGVSMTSRGNRVDIRGAEADVGAARHCLTAMWDQLKRGQHVSLSEVDSLLRMIAAGMAIGPSRRIKPAAPQRSEARVEAHEGEPSPVQRASADDAIEIRTRRKVIQPRSLRQARYLAALRDNELVFGVGPAGTGKTYLAVAMGVAFLLEGAVDRLILSRPAVEAGERLGFLPGDMKDKVDPYMRPLYDALHDMLSAEQLQKYMTRGDIEIAPLAFMRGRTLSNAYVILDEAQNTTPVQMKMFLTRLGENARMAVAGDLSQIDLPGGVPSGLRDAMDRLEGLKGIGVVRFTTGDVVRHPLVARILDAYGDGEKPPAPTAAAAPAPARSVKSAIDAAPTKTRRRGSQEPVSAGDA